MTTHPFTQSVLRKSAGIAIVLLLTTVIATLLTMYGNISATTAITDTLIYVATLAVLGYFYWYVIGFFQVFQSQMAIAIVVQAICLVITLALLSALELEDLQTFTYLIPIRMSISTLSWIVLQQWYNIQHAKEQTIKEEPKEVPSTANEKTAETLDRISVKDGSKIHIISTHEILYIQAYGDYVTFFTFTGKYVKELTMKHLEANLPDSFIRIHRSYIVNTIYVVRIELFGKQTHQVRLKDGSYLHISSNGYKLLKDKLLL